MRDRQPRLSVVICTLDRPAALGDCLASLAAQTRRPDEVLVVDAGRRMPADRPVASAAAAGLPVRRIVSAPGLPRQRNLGIDHVGGDTVLFLDDDVVLDPGYVAAILAIYDADADGVVGGVGGALVPDPTPRERWLRRVWFDAFLLESHGRGRVKRSGRPEYCLSPAVRTDVEFLSGCNMSFRRAVLDAVRFDERLAGYALGEDLHMSHRVARHWRLVLEPAARCDHRHVAGGRPATDDFRTMAVFNKYLFFREQVARRPLDWAFYLWAATGDVLSRVRAPRRRGLRGWIRGVRLVLRHARTGALPPGYAAARDGAAEGVSAPRGATEAGTARPAPAAGGATAPPDDSRVPFVSIVVPARNEARDLGRCLGSLVTQDWPSERLEVVVVENGSTDRTAEVARRWAARDRRLRVLATDAANQADAMNLGVAAARGDIVARVDAHSHVPRDYVARVAAALARHPKAGCVGGPFLPAGRTVRERAAGLARSSRLGVGGGYGADRARADHPVRSVQCGAYRREALHAAGGFDVAMAYGEDEELNWRLRAGGHAIVLCPDLAQRYRPRGTLGGLLRQYWHYGHGRWRVLRKHPDFLAPRHLVPSVLVVLLGTLAVATAVVPGAGIALGGLAAAWGGVLLLAGLGATRAGVREACVVPAAVACLHLGYGAGMLAAAADDGVRAMLRWRPRPAAPRAGAAAP